MKRTKIITRDEMRALKKMLGEFRRIIDVLAQRQQVVVSSLDCATMMLEQYGVKRPAGKTVEISVESAKAMIEMADALKSWREERSSSWEFDADELKAYNEVQDAVTAKEKKL